MKTAKTLMKVKQQALDELKRKIVALESKREDIYQTIGMLADRLNKEIKSAANMPDMMQFFGDFSSHIKKRQDQLYILAARTQKEIDVLGEEIRDVFREIKTYESVYKKWLAAERKKQKKREEAELDDIGIQRFTRKQEVS
jgi:flagellar export protein FliJ